ncbi:hypothetical protein PILCRDRAFT_94104 [Piloderma croceum F 1598]|uniref:CID domain-containing protein n=1 Tax=Piloderma croceum (strain F 1598) TaxID=765440 RepID=A0A0C3GMY3_PILCF|nr:hypothetical protein PILCRDRAFT_94104 [Piloderma croceum F 1598]
MDKTKSKLAAFFDNDDEESPFPQKTVDDQKRSTYAQGTVRKSRREKEKEAAEAKAREEEEHAAKAYAEFLDAFEGQDVGKKKDGSNFVKAGTMPPSPPPTSAPKPKGKRAMDAFLEEIKRDQADRESRYSRNSHGRSVTALAAYEGQSGSKDRGDPETSNVFVANLPPHVTEQTLGNFFARCGPVGSVKVMWPRSDATVGPGADMTASRRNKSAGLSGFVSFMKRKDAEVALRELDGFDWGGSVLRVGWSKAVPMAAKPLYTAGTRSRDRDRRSHTRSLSPYRRRSRSRSPDRRHRPYRRSPSRSRSRSYSPSPSRSHQRQYRHRSDSRSRYDSDRRRRRSDSRSRTELVTDMFIRTVAAEVRGHGAEYEASLKERERHNPKFGFLINKHHRRHAFYRGLVEREDGIDPAFDDEGYNSVYSTDSAEDSERERGRKNVLGRLARRRFEAMLRALSGKRGELARCMAFSLEHAEAAPEVSEIIVASLLVDGTAVPRKVARLHLICDILHNSAASVPSAWKFRQEFQSRLGIVFDHLATIYHSFPGRITAETFKKQITSVVDIWEDWIVFAPDFTAELRARLDGVALMDAEPKNEETAGGVVAEKSQAFASRFKASSFQPAQDSDDLDGEPVEDDVDGEPLNDVDGDPIDDVDGEPMDESGLDGEPMDDDIDGAPADV